MDRFAFRIGVFLFFFVGAYDAFSCVLTSVLAIMLGIQLVTARGHSENRSSVDWYLRCACQLSITEKLASPKRHHCRIRRLARDGSNGVF